MNLCFLEGFSVAKRQKCINLARFRLKFMFFNELYHKNKAKKHKNADKYVIGVLKDNTRARKVYESWGGKLSEYEHVFVVMNVGYPENFYTFEI